MDKLKISRLKKELSSLRNKAAGGMKRSLLVTFAKKVGRKLSARGKETTFSSVLLPDKAPMSIPKHPVIKRFTAENVLDTLEADLDRLWEMAEQSQMEESD